MARGRAPGAKRSFGFEKLRVFDAALWERIKREKRPEAPSRVLFGSDNDPRALDDARAQPRRGGRRALGEARAGRRARARRAGERRA